MVSLADAPPAREAHDRRQHERSCPTRRNDMRATERELAIEVEAGDIVTRGEEWGDQVVRHLTLPAGADFRPLLRGLPGDECQCPHWGYVVAGSITLRYHDGSEETSRAGDLYYWPAGHTGWTDEGVTFIEFSPAADIKPVLEHLGAQLSPSA
jgi:hypothetical protein